MVTIHRIQNTMKMANRKVSTGKTPSGKVQNVKTPVGKTPAGKTATTRKKLSLGLIRERAHEIYLNRIRKGIHGDPDSDWLQAEKELKN
jgi:hypothetical protein